MSRVSVIIPTYNRAWMLRQAIQSVLAQTYRDFEVIVVDDGSTDDTRDTVASIADQRIRYIRQHNQGSSSARNRGAAETDSEFIAFHDSDDIWVANKLERQIQVLDSNPKVDMVCTNATGFTDILPTDIYSSGGVVIEDIYPKLFRGFAIPLPSVIIKRSVYESVGGFDTDLATSHDWDLWLKIAERYLVAHIQESLVLVRRHSGNTTWQNAFEDAKTALKKHPPSSERIDDPEEAISTVLARYCLLTLVGKAFSGMESFDSVLFQEWRSYYSGSMEPIESWLQLLSSALIDAVSCSMLNKCPSDIAISSFVNQLFGDARTVAKAQSAIHQSFAWFYAERNKSSSARHAWSAIARSPKLVSNKGLLKLAIGIGTKPSSMTS